MNILLIEDNLTLSQSLQSFLEKENHTVKTASSWDDAQKSISQESFDLYIIDFLLPDCKGDEALKNIHQIKIHQNSHFILMSGFFDKDFILKLIPENLKSITHFLKKPLKLEKLLETINNLVANTENTDCTLSGDVQDFKSYISKNKNRTFNNYKLIDFLFTAHATNFNGALKITFKDKLENEVHFKDGKIIKIFSNNKNSEEYFGALLVKHGFTLEEEVANTLKENLLDKPLGVLLVEKGLLSPHNISFILKQQINIHLSKMISGSPFLIESTDSQLKTPVEDVVEIPYISKSDLICFMAECIKKKIPDEELETFYIKNKKNNLKLNYLVKSKLSEHKEFIDYYNDFIKNVDENQNVKQIVESHKENRKKVLQILYFGITIKSLFFIHTDKEQMEAGFILDLILKNDSNDLFKNLNLPWEASVEEVKSSYKKLLLVLHPDTLPAHCSPSQKEKYQEAFQKVLHSYEVLSDSEKRKAYINKQENENFLNILLEYEKGIQAIKRGDFKIALSFFDKIMDDAHAPKNTELYILWATIKSNPKTLQTRSVAGHIKNQIDNLPIEHKISAHYWFVNGLYYKYTNNYERAISSFKKAIQIKPNFSEVTKEMSHLRSLLSKKKDVKNGFLSSFFNPKKAG